MHGNNTRTRADSTQAPLYKVHYLHGNEQIKSMLEGSRQLVTHRLIEEGKFMFNCC